MSKDQETAAELAAEIAYIHTIISYLSRGYSSQEAGYLAAGLATEREVRAWRIRPALANFWLALAYEAAREVYT